MGGAEKKKMRIPAAFLACLLGAAPAFAQSLPKPAGAAAMPPAATPVSQSVEAAAPATAKPIEQAIAQPTAQPAEPTAAKPTAKAAEQAATPPTPGPAANEVKRTVTQPTDQPVEQAVAQPTAQPADSAAPVAKPAEPAAAKPAEQAATPPTPAPAANEVKQAVAQPADQPVEAAKPPSAEPAEPSAAPAATEPAAKQEAKPAAKPETKTAAETCPGHPDALGTERVLTLTPGEFQELGVINYKQTLPLKDHEVVLTFDDGPIPPYTNSVLDTLAANCVKATYFLVGEMARLRPYLVRRIYNEGHSIGTHSQTHPFAFQRLSMARVEREVDGGIASVKTALGDPKALSPFFRIPGFGRSNAIDHFLENKGLVTWSADVDTDDWWRGTTPSALIQRTMRRLNARGRGIVLMHDIHPDTALALPRLLKELKKQGYHVVHVVTAGERPKSLPEVVATKAEKEIWPGVLHAKAEKAGAAMSALRHRVKRVIARRSSKHRHYSSKRHHYRRTHTARADIPGKSEAAPASGRAWQVKQF
jgi:peptidoglycan/xylan/chitin deacetylase (PgdA/CDA1 family)